MSTATARLTLNLTVVPRRPQLVVTPGALTVGMTRGRQTVVEAELMNTGSLAAAGLRVAVPAAPWLSLVTPSDLGDLAPGAAAKVGLLLAPPVDLPLGPYAGTIVVAGADASLSVPFRFIAVSAARGDLRFVAEDEFTYFAEGRPRVADARVVLRDASTDAVVVEGTTRADGVLLRQSVAEGIYNLEVTAERHGTYRTSVTVAAGRETEVRAFLPRQLVTYRWTVEPVDTVDWYVVNLQATFETDVPAPVVTASPLVLDLRTVTFDERGEAVVNYTLANQGLIAADDVRIAFEDGPGYRVEPLTRWVGVLPAKGSVVVPVTIRRTGAGVRTASARAENGDGASANGGGAVRALADMATASASGGGCGSSGSVSGSYPCGGRQVSQLVPLTIVTGGCSPTETPSIPRIEYRPSPPTNGSGGAGTTWVSSINFYPPPVYTSQSCDPGGGGGPGGNGGDGQTEFSIDPPGTITHVGRKMVFTAKNVPPGQSVSWTRNDRDQADGSTYEVLVQKDSKGEFEDKHVIKAVAGGKSATPVTLRVFELKSVEAKRADESNSVFDNDPVRFCTDDEVVAKLVFNGYEPNDQQATAAISWQVVQIGAGDGAQESSTLAGTGKKAERNSKNEPLRISDPGKYKIVFFLTEDASRLERTPYKAETKPFDVKSLVIHELSVARHASVRLTAEQVRNILQEGSRLLRRRDYNGSEEKDYRCCIELRMNGDLSTFGTEGDGLADPDNTPLGRKAAIPQDANVTRIQKAYEVPFDIKVVRSIGFCADNPPGSGSIYLGCAQTGFWNMLLRAPGQQPAGQTWAHEFGHAQGLKDAEDAPKEDASKDPKFRIMARSYNAASNAVTPNELKAYEGSRRPHHLFQVEYSLDGGPFIPYWLVEVGKQDPRYPNDPTKTIRTPDPRHPEAVIYIPPGQTPMVRLRMDWGVSGHRELMGTVSWDNGYTGRITHANVQDIQISLPAMRPGENHMVSLVLTLGVDYSTPGGRFTKGATFNNEHVVTFLCK